MARIKRSIFPLFLLSFYSWLAFPANSKIQRFEPEFWWVGMHNPNLQLLVYGDDLASYSVAVNYPGVHLTNMHQVENRNYLFIDLQIDSTAKAGFFDLEFQAENGEAFQYRYELKQRRENSANRGSFDTSDVIYLLMPDRFSNGDPANDSVSGLRESVDRKNPDGRHGGDIQGIINHLDDLQELGVTALWSTPLLEDNEEQGSYHSYAISDFYRVDKRFGGNQQYLKLSRECKKRGIKLIQDMVFNHCASAHWWMQDLPQPNWIHQHQSYMNSNHRKSTIQDPYASEIDKIQFSDGWFAGCMPDLNQKNELLMTYLIQNSIWWVEYADLDGIRMDTYPYNDPKAMSNWGKALLREYPNFNFVGETWYKHAADIAYWQKDANNADGFNSYLPCVMDFQLFFALEKAFLEQQQWDNGLVRLYKSLAADYLYPDRENLLIFAENHDTDRIMSTLHGDINKLKLMMSFLMTTRGIPQIYSGIEIAMEGKKSDGDGRMRIDYPGGWKDDKRNAFIREGRTARENEIYSFMKKLLNWRKNNPVIHNGKLMHYIPENDVYVYFRSNETKQIMVVLNNAGAERTLNLQRFHQNLDGYREGYDIIGEETKDLQNGQLKVKANTALILELKK